MAETTGVAELIVRVKDEATSQMKQLAKVLQSTLDPDQWEEVKKAMEELGVAVEDVVDGLDDVGDAGVDLDKQNKKTKKSTDKLRDSLDDVGDAADLVGGQIGGLAGQASNLVGVLTRVNPILAGIGVAIGSAGLGVKAASDVGVYAKELENLAAVGNVTTQELQAFAAGTERVGFDLDKTADILKDVNDRIGDFTSTGGGALQDYFDALGGSVAYTAQQLQDMSTLDAIQAIQNDLEANNVPLERQIFLWESLAGESAKMIPLIKDNGKALKEFADEADARGSIFTDQEIADAKAFEKALSDMGKSLQTLWRRIGIAVLPVLEGFVDGINDVSDAINSINKALRDGFTDWEDWQDVILETYDVLSLFSPTALAVDKVREAVEGVADANGDLGNENVRRMEEAYRSAQNTLSGITDDLRDMRQAEADITARLAESNISRAKQEKLTQDLAEVQQLIVDLSSQEQLATEKTLQAKIALEAAQKRYNDAQKEGTNLEDEIKEINGAGGGATSLVVEELLADYKAQLLDFYTDTGKTLEDRLSAAAEATFLNYKSVLNRLRALGADTGVVEAIISEETARNQFDILSAEFDRVSEDIELRAEKLGRQVANGIITEATGLEQLQKIYGESGEALEGLLEQMQALAEQTGSQELAQQVEVMSNAIEQFKQDLGEDGFIGPEWVENIREAREAIGELKEELNFNDLTLGNLEQTMENAVNQAKRPLEELREEINKVLSGAELEEANLAIDEAIDIAAVDAKLTVMEDLFNQKVAIFNTQLASIQLAEDQNLITEAEATERLTQAYASLRPELQAISDQMTALAQETGSPELLRRAQELNNAFQELSITVDEATKSMIDNLIEVGAEAAGNEFAQAITDIATQAEDLGDVFDNVMKGILESMLNVVQSQVAQQFTNLLLSAVGGGFGGGATPAFATGGYVRGAGTSTSDSIMARLSDKEFVQPANATAYYGVQFMEMLRRRAIPRELLMSLLGGRSFPVHTPRTPRFSSGGFVSGSVLSSPDGGSRGSDMNVTLVQVKDEEEQRAYVQSRQGQGDIIQVLENNKTKVKNILG